MTDKVTLILGEYRVEASREDLISKSEYFASLLSPNFRDSLSNEHQINYDIDVKTLRTFVAWVSDGIASVVGDRRQVKPSLANYIGKSADFENLLQLLQLSVIFASETLVKDLTDLITCHWLMPEKSVQVWLLARELNLATLRDLAKAACVDRLCDLPVSSLLELPGEDFIGLAGNIHVKAIDNFILNLAKKWVERNVPPGEANAFESRYPFTLISKFDRWISTEAEKLYADEQCERNIQCIVGCKRTEDDKEKLCVYGWDGTHFTEIIEIPSSPTVSPNSIVGMQAAGRGFDVYLVGGEYGENSGHFQMEIWRYSTISKTWYYVTNLPKPRRHMAVVFMGEQLFVIGGWEKTLRRRSTIDVYNVHTGKWSVFPFLNEKFTNTSLIYEQSGSLTLYDDRNVFCYDTDEGKWWSTLGDFRAVIEDNQGEFLDMEDITPQFLMSYGTGLYVLDFDDVRPPKIWEVEDFEHFESRFVGSCLTKFDTQVANGPYLIGFSYDNDKLSIELVKITSHDTMENKIVYKETRSDIRDLCPWDSHGSFNLFNLNSLNEQFVLKDVAKY